MKTRRWPAVLTLTLVAAFLAYPLYALFEFSIRFPLTGKYSWDSWVTLLTGVDADRLQPVYVGVVNSILIAVLTVAIMLVILLPTMIWVRLRLPKLKRVLEFCALLPLTLPAIVLVVGLVPIYRFLAINLLGTDAIWLCFAYVILVLPYAYRSLDSGLAGMDLQTLTAAARSMGASWLTVLLRVILPNLRSAVASAAFISVAVVLGEYTISRLLARETLQTGLVLVNQEEPQVAAAVSLLSLLFGVVLLLGISIFTNRRHSR